MLNKSVILIILQLQLFAIIAHTILENDQKINELYSKCSTSFIQQFTTNEDQKLLFLIDGNPPNLNVENFITKTIGQKSVGILTQYKCNYRWNFKEKDYRNEISDNKFVVVNEKNAKTAIKTIWKFYNTIFWNNHAKFLITLHETESEIEFLAKKLQLLFAARVIISTFNQTTENVSYFAIKYVSDCYKSVSLEQIATCNNDIVNGIVGERIKVIYPNPKPYTESTLYQGLENCSLNVHFLVDPPFTNVLPNGKLSGALFSLTHLLYSKLNLHNVTYIKMKSPLELNRLSNIAAFDGKDFMEINSASNYELICHCGNSQYIHITHVVIAVPPAKFWPLWKNISGIFNLKMWTATLILLFLGPCVWRLLAMNQSTKHSFINVIMSFFAMNIGLASTINSSTLKNRLLLVVWLLYCMQFNLLFQSRYTTLSTRPMRDTQIDSVDEILSQNYNIYYKFDGYLDMALAGLNTRDKTKLLHLAKKLDKNISMATVVREKSSAVFSKRHYIINEFFSFYNNETGTFDVHVLSNPVVVLPVVMMVRLKGHIFMEGLDKLIGRTHSNGLWTKFLLDEVTKQSLVQNIVKKNTEELSWKMLNLAESQCSFVILIFGILASALFFLVEIVTF